jgi:hypothetical protein
MHMVVVVARVPQHIEPYVLYDHGAMGIRRIELQGDVAVTVTRLLCAHQLVADNAMLG